MVVNPALILTLLVFIPEVLVLGLPVYHREEPQQHPRLLIARLLGPHERGNRTAFGAVGRPELGTREVVLRIAYGWHTRGNHLPLEPRKPPRLRRKLHNALHRNLNPLFLPRIREMLDRVHNLLDDGARSGVDALLCAAAGKRREERLLPPDGLLARALVADVRAHRGEERVGFVVAAAEAEEEGPEDAVGDEFGDGVRDVGGTECAGGRRVCEEGREVRGDLLQLFRGRDHGEVDEVGGGEVEDLFLELREGDETAEQLATV